MSTRAQILAEIAAQFPDNTTGLVTIQPDGTETISGDTPLVLTSQWDSAVFVSDGANWVRCS